MQFELTKEFIDDVKIAIEREDNSFLVKTVHPLHPADIAEILDIVNLPEAQYIFKQLEEDLASDVLVEIEEDTRDEFLNSLTL